MRHECYKMSKSGLQKKPTRNQQKSGKTVRVRDGPFEISILFEKGSGESIHKGDSLREECIQEKLGTVRMRTVDLAFYKFCS
mmetsp:Transcript_20473/g.23198  ORF Transcript_20473/g.23198 Transcript_20473/m.23198 type:complete len:82 (-) Transcript_20473:282-527(-)